MGKGKRAEKERIEENKDKVKIEVFTSPTCPHCRWAIKVSQEIEGERADVKVVETSTATREGSKRAEIYGVISVPTVFVKGPKSDIIAFRGTPMKKELNHAIDISLGRSQMPEKSQGFFSKIFG